MSFAQTCHIKYTIDCLSEGGYQSNSVTRLTLWWVTADRWLRATSTPSSQSLIYEKERKTSSSPIMLHKYAKRTMGWVCPSSSSCKEVRSQPQRELLLLHKKQSSSFAGSSMWIFSLNSWISFLFGIYFCVCKVSNKAAAFLPPLSTRLLRLVVAIPLVCWLYMCACVCVPLYVHTKMCR